MNDQQIQQMQQVIVTLENDNAILVRMLSDANNNKQVLKSYCEQYAAKIQEMEKQIQALQPVQPEAVPA
ncbi:hypothetical protein M977_04309 [Buttiauxella gaviniae ATCC 51604]|uniref:Uncharacterized protein n=1 Tax=Buttiauxella gaviniae ATCC 51604 TaxID=1354253 RepID=A0A1B7HN73_9ENTR|nr:hypothetical protein [Buttiauxella gaviniae]OAT17063.1 hypothetical protein M977_04309 [Buttiauxella gaviniae ATCC 51604]